MWRRGLVLVMIMTVAVAGVWGGGAPEEEPATVDLGEFDWTRYEGQTVTVLANNNPVGRLLEQYANEFTELTGINVEISLYGEHQFRQRHQTIMQAESSEIDLFMSLPSREGMLFERAGWYEPLMPFVENDSLTSPDYDFDDFGAAVIENHTVNGILTGIPMNIEGPVLYYRHDVFEEHGMSHPPGDLDELREMVGELAELEPDMVPFATRGLAPAVPYTFTNFLYNFGGSYTDDEGRASLSTPEGIEAIEMYAGMLRDYGAEGAINHSFPQLTALNTGGESIMTFQSSNEFDPIMETEDRRHDTSIAVLPPGPAGSTPVVIGWQLSISPYSENKELAWYFIQWATSQEMQVVFGLEGLAPPRTSVWDSAEFQEWLGGYEVRRQWADALAELAETGSDVLAPQILLQPEAREVIGEAIGSVILGEASAEEAAQQADDQLDALIDRSAMF